MKHAYCILAHNNFTQLSNLLQLLDDDRNDIYLHIDKKTTWGYEYVCNYSSICYVDSIDVAWGDISLADAEYNLFKAVLSSGIEYSTIWA